MQCFVVMGVSGCGKTTVGTALAKRINARFIDGDALHPQSNIDKMSRGDALDDDDRAPWLRQVGQTLRESDTTIIVGCSALKRMYRDTIRDQAHKPVCFLHLNGSRSVLEVRMGQRTGHFMPPSLLDSQLAALEPLGDDELAIVVDIDKPIDALVQELAAHIEDDSR